MNSTGCTPSQSQNARPMEMTIGTRVMMQKPMKFGAMKL